MSILSDKLHIRITYKGGATAAIVDSDVSSVFRPQLNVLIALNGGRQDANDQDRYGHVQSVSPALKKVAVILCEL